MPGLRREEVAHLAGMSVDYYSRLEQGRHTTPSASVVEALARALRLDDAARAHLIDLARPVRHWAAPAPQVQRVRPGALRLDAGRHPDDPALTELAGELTIKSPEFRTAWSDHRVHERTHGTKRLTHPAVGPLTLQFEALALPGDADQVMFVYTAAPGSSSADNLRLLASWTASTARLSAESVEP